jgi:hypothetical protein
VAQSSRLWGERVRRVGPTASSADPAKVSTPAAVIQLVRGLGLALHFPSHTHGATHTEPKGGNNGSARTFLRSRARLRFRGCGLLSKRSIIHFSAWDTFDLLSPCPAPHFLPRCVFCHARGPFFPRLALPWRARVHSVSRLRALAAQKN